jgi:hypothetical protein
MPERSRSVLGRFYCTSLYECHIISVDFSGASSCKYSRHVHNNFNITEIRQSWIAKHNYTAKEKVSCVVGSFWECTNFLSFSSTVLYFLSKSWSKESCILSRIVYHVFPHSCAAFKYIPKQLYCIFYSILARIQLHVSAYNKTTIRLHNKGQRLNKCHTKIYRVILSLEAPNYCL